jgi:hypothetical protein
VRRILLGRTHDDDFAVRYLGVTCSEARRRFGECLAERGWTWSQHGHRGWQIHHVRGKAEVDRKVAARAITLEDGLAAHHISNLVPMWHDEH